MKRRSFLALVGLAPVAAKAMEVVPVASEPFYEGGTPLDLETAWETPAIHRIYQSEFGPVSVKDAQRTYNYSSIWFRQWRNQMLESIAGDGTESLTD